MKEICSTCIHQGTVPNSRHSSCHCPRAEQLISFSGELRAFLLILLQENRVEQSLIYPMRLEISDEAMRVNEPIQNGWFTWPFNFDPIWIEKCTGHTEAGK